MTISAATARERWRETNGKDPLFAAIDGKNCPNLPQDEPASHSLLLERGLIRVFLPWPPRKADGTRIDPEFTIEVVRDPTRCNTDPRHAGLLTEIFNYAPKIPGARLKVAASRGAMKLSNGRVLTERPGIAMARAEEIAELFQGAGISRSSIESNWRDDAEPADGVEDWRSRRVTVRVEP